MFLFGLITSFVVAQTFDYNKAYQDFVFNLSLYQEAHNLYTVAKAQYLSSDTITAQEKAKSETLKMLSARDQAVSTYLTAIRMKIRETNGIADAEKNGLYGPIDTDIDWYNDHKTNLATAGSLDDLVEDSNEAKVYFTTITESMVYKNLVQVSIGKTTDFRNREKEIINTLKLKLSEIRTNGDKNVDSYERAVLDAEGRLERSQEKDREALSIINTIKDSSKDKLSKFNSAEVAVGQSLAYIKEANGILSEIVKGVSTAD